nr:hypothetical protein [Escherichia coli]
MLMPSGWVACSTVIPSSCGIDDNQIRIVSPWKVEISAPEGVINAPKSFTVNSPQIALNGDTAVSKGL